MCITGLSESQLLRHTSGECQCNGAQSGTISPAGQRGGAATVPAKQASLVLQWLGPAGEEARFESEAPSITIGRVSSTQTPDVDLTHDMFVSRPHARISREGDAYWIEDLGSSHGTCANGTRIETRTPLHSGDEITIGQTTLRVTVVAGEPEEDLGVGEALVAEPKKTPAAPEPEVAVAPPEAQTAPEGEAQRAAAGIVAKTLIATAPPSQLLVPPNTAAGVSLRTLEQRLDALFDLGADLAGRGKLDELLDAVLRHLREAVPSPKRAGILLMDHGRLLLKAHFPYGNPSVSMSLAQRAVEKKEAFLWHSDLFNEPLDLSHSVIINKIVSALYAPILWQDETLGVAYMDMEGSSGLLDESDLRVMMAIVNYVAIFLKNYTLQQELVAQESVKAKLLAQFSPRVAERLMRQPGRLKLGGERVEEVTVLMSDVRGFTAISTTLDPEDLVQMLNEMFGALTPLIFKYDGTIDKYVGDAILAVFGSPEPVADQWEKSVQAAIEMQAAMKQLADTRRSEGKPAFQIGIGIHSGAVVHGLIGSPQRMEYTVIGDTVNQASRCCDGAGAEEIVIGKPVFEKAFRLVNVVPRTITTKHPDTEAAIEAFAVTGLRGSG